MSEMRFVDAVLQMNITAAREGWREPVDIEVDRDVFIQLVFEAQSHRRKWMDGSPPLSRPVLRFPVFERFPAVSFISEATPEKFRSDTVDIDMELAHNGLCIHVPQGTSTVRLKPKARQEMISQIARNGR